MNQPLQRKKSLIKPERSRSIRRGEVGTVKSTLGRSDTVQRRQLGESVVVEHGGWWTRMSRVITFYSPFALLSYCGMRDRQVQQAFREKIALCTIIATMMVAVAFITFGLQASMCRAPKRLFPYTGLSTNKDVFAVAGMTYFLPQNFVHPAVAIDRSLIAGKDLTFLFQSQSVACTAIGVKTSPIACTSSGVWPITGVYAYQNLVYCKLSKYQEGGQTFFSWADMAANTANSSSKQLLVVYSGQVLDVTKYKESPQFLGPDVLNITMSNIGSDITYLLLSKGLKHQADCLSDIFAVAYVDTQTAGCFVSNIILYVSLAFIGGVVLIRFFIALFYGLFLGWRLGDPKGALLTKQIKPTRSTSNEAIREDVEAQFRRQDIQDPFSNPNLMHTLVMVRILTLVFLYKVPCYSEGLDSMRTTLQSIVDSDYPSTHTCIVVVADGVVQGTGNTKPTFEFVIDMMDIDHRFSREDPSNGGSPPSYSYVAIADGAKRKNYAKVYAGWYKRTLPASGSLDTLHNDDVNNVDFTVKRRSAGRIPILLVVKVGNDEEQGQKKAGNRGKRDSQVVLMNFLSKVMFDDRMTELEFDIFYKLWTITGVIPDKYEAVMMVDADTMIYKSALRHLIAAMIKDPDVIGICGETRVGNKWQSWVTMIQVFEYHISHNLSKAFETVFGVVTCLPGCFSVYRVSAPKGPGFCVPILANPDIVEEYSENVVDTLHKKNLLLLGEDRYLSTLMLKAFPKRKMIYIPNAVCETVVPDEFMVLLSQRRRWINSTIHNLLELILVRNLCGIFCFSMQFVIFMELFGTVVLPAAISFTIYIIISSAIPGNVVATIPLILLAVILGLPGLLTVLISGDITHLFWMLIYLVSLPIWSFVFPLYSFWHMNDFSWGETRVVIGDQKGEDHGRRQGDFDGSGISMKRWEDWMTDRRQRQAQRSQRTRENIMLFPVQAAIQPRVVGSPNVTYTPLQGRLNAALPTPQQQLGTIKDYFK